MLQSVIPFPLGKKGRCEEDTNNLGNKHMFVSDFCYCQLSAYLLPLNTAYQWGVTYKMGGQRQKLGTKMKSIEDR